MEKFIWTILIVSFIMGFGIYSFGFIMGRRSR